MIWEHKRATNHGLVRNNIVGDMFSDPQAYHQMDILVPEVERYLEDLMYDVVSRNLCSLGEISEKPPWK